MRYLAPLLFLTACTGGDATRSSPPPTVPIVPTPTTVVRGLTLVPGGDGALVLADTRMELADGVIRTLAPTPQASTEIADAYGDLITPGFVDAHAHLEGLGRLTSELNLVGLPTYKAVLKSIDAHSKAATPGSWILGRGWDQNDWPDTPKGGWPTADDLDAVSHGHPVALRRVDGHATWANHAALDASAIRDESKTPAGGQLLRHESGTLNGVLVDNAVDLLTVPEPTKEQRRTWVLRAQKEMLGSGLTGLHDMGTHDDTLAILRAMDDSGELIIRVWSYLPADSTGAERLLQTGPQIG
ncbi:MAG: putative amidohydrolase YtcJ, partial [Kiritimatiellia bacterium]